MQLSIYTKGPHARAVSHLLAKNPQNLYEREEKGHTVRFLYHTMTDCELYATFFVTPDSLALVKENEAFDITHYINDREFAVSTIFLSLIRSALSSALKGKAKEGYEEYVDMPLPYTFEVGPVSSKMSDEEIRGLFEVLGYKMTIEAMSDAKRARFLTLSAKIPLHVALKQLYILIPVMDDYKHYFIDEREIERLNTYGEGWIENHPMREVIYQKALRFRELYESNESTELSKQTPLYTQRYQSIYNAVRSLGAKTVVEMGAGEGKLSALLAQNDQIEMLYSVDPSNTALAKMEKRFAEMAVKVPPIVKWGSLYYEDETFYGVDALILCEVIEHIEKEQLPKVMQLVTERYAPKHIIITTPNAEYNAVYELDSMRHEDHRFEMTRIEFQEWCKQNAPLYDLRFQGIGEVHEKYGTPTQMCIMTRRDSDAN